MAPKLQVNSLSSECYVCMESDVLINEKLLAGGVNLHVEQEHKGA